MDAWIGPAIIAALVSGIVSVLGWIATFRTSVRLDELRRAEKVRDFQIALHAEISSDLLNMVVFDREQLLVSIRQRYEAEPGFSVIVPHMATNVVFDAIVKEIHILPGRVIRPVVNYARLRQTLERFVLDLRDASFAQLSAARQLDMYSDYLETLGRLEALAQQAVVALEGSLQISSQDAVPLSRASAEGPDGAETGGSAYS